MLLSFITYGFIRFEVAKQFSDRHRIEQRVADYTQDIKHASVQSVVVLRDSDQAISANGSVDLDAHRIFACAPKPLDLQVLLEPLKEQLDLPAILVQQSDILCTNLPVVGQIDKRPVVLLAVKTYSSELTRKPLLSCISRQADSLVKQDVIFSVKHLVSIGDFVLDIVLLTDDKVGLQSADIVQPSPIVIAFVKDIVSVLLVRDLVHRSDIVHISGSNMKERRDLRHYIKQGVHLDSSLLLAKGRPPKDAQTEINSRRIKGIEFTLQLKNPIDSLTLSHTDKMICKLLKYPVISLLISLGEVTSSDSDVSESKMLRLGFVSHTEQNHLAQTAKFNQLSEHHHQQLIPTCKRTHVLVALIFINHSVEHSMGQQVHQLPKHVFAHPKSNLKIRPILSKKCARTLTEEFYYLNTYK